VDPGSGRIAAVPPALIATEVVRAAGGPFGFSRALPPEMRRDLAGTGVGVELPTVGGRTVIPADWEHPVVLGHPNYFGRFETDPPRGTILVTGRWANLHPKPPGMLEIEDRAAVAAPLAADLLERARHLAKRLAQHRGVHIPFAPQAPVIVALLPRSVHPDLAAADLVALLAGDFPEFPGGIRIELPARSDTAGGVRYAERLERLVTEGT